MRRFLSIFIAMILSFNYFTAIAEEDVQGNVQEDVLKIYVSVSGNDENPGTEDAPLKTLDGARKKVRLIKKEKPVEIIFSGGVYRFTDGVVFDEMIINVSDSVYKALNVYVAIYKGKVSSSGEYSMIIHKDCIK